MNENTITITLDEYKELIRGTERIAILSRMARAGRVYDEDVKVVLGIGEAKEGAEND